MSPAFSSPAYSPTSPWEPSTPGSVVSPGEELSLHSFSSRVSSPQFTPTCPIYSPVDPSPLPSVVNTTERVKERSPLGCWEKPSPFVRRAVGEWLSGVVPLTDSNLDAIRDLGNELFHRGLPHELHEGLYFNISRNSTSKIARELQGQGVEVRSWFLGNNFQHDPAIKEDSDEEGFLGSDASSDEDEYREDHNKRRRYM